MTPRQAAALIILGPPVAFAAACAFTYVAATVYWKLRHP